MRLPLLATVISVGLGWQTAAWSQAFIDELSPPVLRRGTVNRLQVIGSQADQAVGLWTSLPEGMIQARSNHSTKQQATLDVVLKSECPLGIYGLRLATRSGLSNIHLFVVDELPVLVRQDNLSTDEVVPVTLPIAVTAIGRPAAVDRYSITVSKDQIVTFDVIGNRLGKDYDPLVQIRDTTNRLLASCDNSVGLLFDCRFAYRFSEPGTYIVEIRDARFEGRPGWHYVLRMGDFPVARTAVPSGVRIGEITALNFPQASTETFSVSIPADVTPGDILQEIRHSPSQSAGWVPLTLSDLPTQLESEPNNTTETATPVTVPGTLNGYFHKPGDLDWFSFELTKDQKLTFQGVSRTIGSAADLELILFDVDGREVRRVDDTELEEGGFAFNAGKAGLHRLQVRELSRDGGGEFTYRIDVKSGGPQFQLQCEAPEVSIPRGSDQSVAVKVIRTEYSGEIQLELIGAPPGITLEPSIVPADSGEFVGRIRAASSTPEGVYTLQILGKGISATGTALHSLARVKPLVDRQLKNVDLIPYALREDQRHLPPSLTDRIALMVVAPTPFNLELPESIVQLTRFQTAEFPIVTTREAGFAEPITFTVKGGQIGDEKEERNQVYARFVPATEDRLVASGTFFNRINTQLNKHRVDLTASTEVDGRRINLIRSFTLNVRSAFQPTYEPEIPAAEPGGTARVRIFANRVPSFDGPMTLHLGPNPAFAFPATVQIPAGQLSVEVEFKVDPKLNPGRHGIRVEVTGFVGKYEESLNLSNLQIEVKKPMP